MKRIVLIGLIVFSPLVSAKSRLYNLSPFFNGMDRAEFVSVDGEFGPTLKGELKGKDGGRYSLPDVCESEGGAAEISDAYTVKAKEIYFVFTCAWSVQHSGIGLSGIQYETFIYGGNGLNSVLRKETLSQALSSYEGSLEGGESSYAWYVERMIAREKILELEAGLSKDSLELAHSIVLARLKSRDYTAIKSYLSVERVRQLYLDFPVSKSTVIAYNDFGYALGLSGEEGMAYEVLKKVETVEPNRVVLKLNIADVLWGSDKEKSKAYYREYVGAMKKLGREKLIPSNALERGLSD